MRPYIVLFDFAGEVSYEECDTLQEALDKRNEYSPDNHHIYRLVEERQLIIDPDGNRFWVAENGLLVPTTQSEIIEQP